MVTSSKSGGNVRTGTKKTLLLGLAVVFVLALASAAMAADAPVILSDGAAGGGYLTPTAGQNPHGGYSSTSNKCKVCHAVHGAEGAEALLRSTRANACVYCHTGSTFSIMKPYGTDATRYTNDYENNHSATHSGTTYNGCVNCHSVHGSDVLSNVAENIDEGMILRTDPGGAMMGTGTGAVAAPATDLDTFCRDCHDGTARADGSGTCTGGCHPQAMQVTDDPNRNGVSHIMTTAKENAGGTEVAFLTSETCRSCHSGAQTYVDGNSFPHITSGAQFLADTHTSTSPLDQVCLDCHVWNGGASGVGATF